MRKTKEICRLADADLSAHAISRVLGASNSTVSYMISRPVNDGPKLTPS